MSDHFRTLVSTKVLTLDEKNRLMLPAEWRRTFEAEAKDGFAPDAYVMIEGPNGQPWLYTEGRFEKQVADWEQQLTDDEDKQDFGLSMFGMSRSLKADKAGRLVLPEDILQQYALKDEVAAVGNGIRIELWDPATWDAKKQQLRSRLPLLASKNRRPPSDNGPRA